MYTREERWLLTEKYQGIESPAFTRDRARLAAGEPLAYLIGHVPFLHTTIHLDSRPLIPRTETEFWTAYAIELIQKNTHTEPIRILDLCAGSGCIGVAAGHAVSSSTVVFSEIDPRHHHTIRKNCATNHIAPERSYISIGNLFENLTGTFAYILSNPPYIDPAHDRSDQSVHRFEPHHALYGGHRGAAYITQILDRAAEFLQPNGVLWIEHEPEHTDFLARYPAAGLHYHTTHNDQYGNARVSQWTMALYA